MIPRISEQCYWMTRYLERGEILVRTLLEFYRLNLDHMHSISLLSSFSEEEFFSKYNDCKEIDNFLIWEEDNPSSLVSCIKSFRENGRLIQEVLLQEGWEIINGLFLWMTQDSGWYQYKVCRYEFYKHILQQFQLFKGIFSNTFLRDDYFHFMKLGLMIERAANLLNFFDVFSANSSLSFKFLPACCGMENHYIRNNNDFDPETITHFLFDEKLSPYSICYCLDKSYLYFSILFPEEKNLLPISKQIKKYEDFPVRDIENKKDVALNFINEIENAVRTCSTSSNAPI